MRLSTSLYRLGLRHCIYVQTIPICMVNGGPPSTRLECVLVINWSWSPKANLMQYCVEWCVVVGRCIALLYPKSHIQVAN